MRTTAFPQKSLTATSMPTTVCKKRTNGCLNKSLSMMTTTIAEAKCSMRTSGKASTTTAKLPTT